MNCKQGDLAIVVKSNAGNEGKIVRCVRFLGNLSNKLVDCWEIDRMVPTAYNDGSPGRQDNFFPDSYLRPIKPLPELESLQTEVEKKIKEPA